MSTAYLIEPATSDDFLNVAALDRIAWRETPDTFIPDGEHIWRVWCDHATLLVARRTDEIKLPHTANIAGATVVFPTLGSETFLHKIMVHPDCRGEGIGSALMRAALEQAPSTVLLTVDPANTAAMQLYENFGFRLRTMIPGYYRSHEDRNIMEFVV
ncbi:MAG: hypothetical protein CMJ78_20535 [Planctomycetaceae bacterium]|nr:hypothetical protein [Planctomycetaceae bacterium]